MNCRIEKPYTNLVLGIPHAVGNPGDIDWADNPAAVAEAERWTDWFTDELFTVDRKGVSLVRSHLSRFDCDAERLEDESDRICKFARHFGADGQSRVPASRWNRRLAQWFRYRCELMTSAAEGDRPLILDCHSFPSDLAPDVDVDLGFNDDASRPSDEVVAAVADVFRAAGFRVALNRPYANAIAPYGYRGHSLMIEINKRCYMNEARRCRHAGFTRCHAAIGRICELLTPGE